MATSGSWRVYGSVEGLASGTRAVDVTIDASTTAVDQTTTQTFTAATYAAITVPSGATAMLIIPDSAYAGTITLKGASGDTGVKLNSTKPSAIALGSSPTPGLLCSTTTTITIVFM